MSSNFDYAKWNAKLIFEHSRYEFIHYYVSDENSLLSHANSYKLTSLDQSGEVYEKKVSEESEQFRTLIVNQVSKGVSEALNTLSRQMVVVAASYAEGIIEEFFQSLFNKHPYRMHDYLSWHSESPKGWIPIKIVLDSDDKEQVINNAIHIACNSATSGDISAISKRIEKLSKNELEIGLKEKLIELFEFRNKIVHERYEPDLGKSQVLAIFEITHELLHTLSVILLRNQVLVHDPTGYFDGFV